MTGVRFVVGAMAWNSEPELYSKTSAMSPVESWVLTRLSPSPPPGRVSSLTSMSSFSASNALMTASAILTLFGSLLVRNEIVVLPDSSSLDPSEPALHADRDTAPVTRAAAASVVRGEAWNLMGNLQ